MISIDCTEVSADEMLALAAAIGEGTTGGIPTIKDDEILVDALPGTDVTLSQVLAIVKDFISRRKDSGFYSTETEGDKILIQSPDPIRGLNKKLQRTPPSRLQCPVCGFFASDEDELAYHSRIHDLARGLAR